MGLIKSNNAPPTLAAFSMKDIESQARAIILRATQQADQILAKAQTEGIAIRQKAYDQGFVAGREDGSKKGGEEGRASGKQAALTEHKAKLEQLIKALSGAVTSLDSSRSALESTASAEVIRLAVAIARRVTKIQGLNEPQVLTENITAAMRLVVHSTDVRIAVNPAQKASFTEVLPQLKLKWPNVSHVEIVEDAKLAPGGCRIFTAGGEIEADLDAQIDRVAGDLLPAKG